MCQLIEHIWHACHRLITPENIASIYRDSLVFILAMILLAIFRKPLASLLQRISENENSWLGKTKFIPSNLPTSESKFPSNENSGPAAQPAALVAEAKIDKYKSAHFYWLGSDLMQAIQSVAINNRREDAIQNLSQSLRHFKKSGLRDDEIERRLKWLIELNEKTVLSEWQKEQFRKDVINEIVIIRQKISDFVKKYAGQEFKAWED
jgi:hypothetical protein